ncbi:putative secondary metabolism biosynthetic enzyme [Microsporum ferrugineum]
MSHCTPYPSEMRSLTTEIDRLAASRPEGLFAKIPVSSDAEIAWHNITWLQLAKYVSTMSHWIEAHLGPAMENEPVAYMVINDIRYPVCILAAMKTGYNALLTSPRNSNEGQLSLLSSTKCQKFLYFISRFMTFQVPDLEYLLQSGPGDAPYEDRFLHKEHKTALILHSSGTTGLLKPVYIKAGALAVITSIKEMPAPEGRRYMHDELFTPKLMVSMMPFFHIMGIISLARVIYHQGTFSPSPGRATCDCGPHDVSDKRDKAILSTLEYTFYGGAPLSRQCGDIVSKVTNLQAGIGSTEMLHVPSYIPLLPEDWEYFEWSNECGIAMEAAMDGLFELVMKQTFNRENQMVFYNYPGLSEWRTKDLFEKHPTKSGMWRYAGQADGMVTLSNGEKLNPLPFEKSMESHPWVRSALIIGSERFQAGLIIEPQPKQLTVGPREFIDHVWPWIENANAQCPTHAKVWKSMVILATPEKPFIFTSKGSIMRRATCQLYQAKIDQLYAKEKVSNDVGVAEFHGQANSTAVKSLLRETFRAMLHPIQGELQDTTDIFHLGANSLQILQLSNELNRIFHRKSNGRNICPPRVIYGNPSIDRLCEVIMQALNGGDYLAQGITESALSREEKMSAMIHTHEIATPNFERIYCLNRSADAASSQKQSFRDRGMGLVGFASKVEFITADFSRDRRVTKREECGTSQPPLIEWVPSLIATSKALGKIPRSLGTEDTIDWVPIGIAQAILDITVSLLTPDDSSTPPDCFNLVNPQVAEWKDMVHVIRGFYQKQRDNAMDLEPVEFRDWVQALRNIGATTREQIDQYPSVKLLEFFEEMQEGKIKVRWNVAGPWRVCTLWIRRRWNVGLLDGSFNEA